MPKTVDQRVVEMQFDNSNFEKNVSQSMSTLDKLKEKLSFKGASKAMDELNGAFKEVNTNPISNALGAVGDKFNALEQIAIGALRRIGDQAVVAGEKLIKSLTSDNIAAGWQKFGEKTTSVATLVAQGYDIEKVEEELEKLNFFTDETSYSFTEMVNNIGKFTASGQGLEESVIAMQGIATWAALSGQNAQTASRAMYQLSQAMGSGVMRKEDYKSIQNASMDTQEFRQKAIDAAIALGTLKDNNDGTFKSLVKNIKDGDFTISQFADHLTEDAWFTSDVMMMVYKDYGKASNTLSKYMENFSGELDTASAAMADIEGKAKAMAQTLVDSGKYSTIGDAMDEALETTALDQIAKMPGMYEQAQAFADRYNSTLEDGQEPLRETRDILIEMGYGLDEFSLKAFKAAQEARTWEDVISSVQDAVSTSWMNTFQSIFGNQKESTQLWTRFANDFWDIFASGGEDRNAMLEKWNEWIDDETRASAEIVGKFSSAARDALIAEKAINGSDLLFSQDEDNLGAIISLLQTIKDLLGIIKDAWNQTFYGTTDADEVAQQKADMLMNITKALKAFADMIRIDDEKANKLRRTFEGLFAILGIIKDLVGTALNSVFKVFGAMFGNTNVDILDMTANLGDNLVAFRKWLQDSKTFENIFGGIGNAIAGAITWIKNIFDYITKIPFIANIIDGVRSGLETTVSVVGEFFDRISKGEGAGDVFGSIIDRLKEGNPVLQFFIDAFNKIKEFIGGIGTSIGDFFGGIWNGITGGISNVGEFFGNVGKAISDFFTSTGDQLNGAADFLGGFVEYVKGKLGEINGDKLIRIIAATAVFTFLFKMISTIKNVIDVFSGLSDVFDSIGDAVDVFSKTIKGVGDAVKQNLRAQSFKSVAAAILMLVAAIAVLYFIVDDVGKFITITSAIVALMVAITVLGSFAAKSQGILKLAAGLVAVGFALGILIAAITVISSINGDALGAVGILALLVLVLGLITAITVIAATIMAELGQTRQLGKNLALLALAIISISAAVLMMSIAAKLISTIDQNAIWAVVGAIAVLAAAVAGLIVVSSIFKTDNLKEVGIMMLGMSASLLIFAGAIALFSVIPTDVFYKGLVRIAILTSIVGAIIVLSQFSGESAHKAGLMMIEMAVAFAAMVGVVALINLLSTDTLLKGVAVIAAFSLIAAGLVAVSRFAGDAAAKAGLMMVGIATSMLILTGVLWALAYVPTQGLVVAAAVVGGLMAIMGLLVGMTRLGNAVTDAHKTLVIMTIAIVALSACIATLAMIPDKIENVVIAAASIALVLLTFGAVIALTKNAQNILTPIIAITVAVIAIGVMLKILATSITDANVALYSALGMSAVLIAMAGALYIITQITDQSMDLKAMLGNILAMSAAIALIGLVLTALSAMGVQNAISNAIALSVVLLALSVSLALITNFGDVKQDTLDIFVIMAVAVGILGVILGAIAVLPIDNALEKAAGLSVVLLAMAGVVAILSWVGPSAEGAIAGVAVMILLAIIIGSFIVILGELATGIPQFELWINTGLPLLEKIGYGIGAFFGNIIGGLLGGISNGIVQVMANIITALNMLGGIDQNVLTSAKTVAEILVIMAGAELINSISNLLNNPIFGAFGQKNSLSDNLIGLADAVLGFNDAIAGKTIDTAKVSIFTMAAQGLVTLAAALPKHGGLASGIFGDNDLRTFAEDMQGFAPRLVQVMNTLSNPTDPFGNPLELNTDNVKTFIEAATLVSDFANTLGKHGGFVGAIFGDSSLNQFADDMYAFAPKLIRVCAVFADPKDENGNSFKIDVNAVQTATNAAKLVSEFAKGLPKTGGALEFWTGKASMNDFGIDMMNFAPKLVKFAETVKDLDDTAVSKAAVAGEMLLKLSNGLPNVGGALSFFIGRKQTLSEFAENMEPLGDGIKKFSDKITEGNGVNSKAMEAATNALEVLVSMKKALPDANVLDYVLSIFGVDLQLDTFKNNMPKFAEAVKSFSDALMKDGGINVDSVNAAADTLSAIAQLSTIESFGDLSALTSQLVPIATNLKEYSDTLSDNSSFNTQVVADTAASIRTLARLAEDTKYVDFTSVTEGLGILKEISGILQKVSTFDENKIKAFGDVIADFGSTGFTDFLNAFDGQEDALERSALGMLNGFIRGIENNQNEFTTVFEDLAKSGINTIATYYDSYKAEGTHIAEDFVAGIDEKLTDQNTGVAATISNAFSGMGGSSGGFDVSSIVGGIGIPTSAQSGMAKQWSADLTSMGLNIDTSGAASAVAGSFLGDLGKSFNFDLDSLGVTDFKDKIMSSDGLGFDMSSIGGDWMSQIGGNLDISNLPIGDFVSQLTGKDGLGVDMTQTGKDYVSDISTGITSDESVSTMKEAGDKTAKQFIEGYKQQYESIKETGRQSVRGLANGISEMTSEAVTAGNGIAKALVSGIELTLKIQSPSKVTYGLGEYAVIGFINAVEDYTDISHQAGADLGDSTTDGIKEALEKSADLFDTTVDLNPTIKPVVDLSDVTTSAEYVNQAFGDLDPALSSSMNLAGTINRSMSGDMTVQNELKVDNSDVVSAIGSLQTDINALGEKVGKMQVFLDTNVLVGELTEPMNKSLGTRYSRNRREG